mmetsp:Transcript_77590/g.251208  ORF Transcript_77590/g.251208 Transcript_77590/m.251208 type:complete len:103 (+) Transcript_77590:1174-1482(+)
MIWPNSPKAPWRSVLRTLVLSPDTMMVEPGLEKCPGAGRAMAATQGGGSRHNKAPQKPPGSRAPRRACGSDPRCGRAVRRELNYIRGLGGSEGVCQARCSDP